MAARAERVVRSGKIDSDERSTFLIFYHEQTNCFCALHFFCSGYSFCARSSRKTIYVRDMDPRHEAKPLVEGFATERVTERLNRGLYAVPSQDGKGVYLSWRLLNTDAPALLFMYIVKQMVKLAV